MTRAGVVPGRPGIVLPALEESERGFHFLSGRPCLALVTTVGERWARNFERLVTPAHLDRWLDGAGLAVDAMAPATEADLDAARALRDAVHVLACEAEDAQIGGRAVRYAPEAVTAVAAAATAPALVPVLGREGERWWALPSGDGDVRAALSTVARDAVDLFSSNEATGVRHCEASDCSLVFLDTSRGRRRRWCSMAACGNRAKQRAHRERAS